MKIYKRVNLFINPTVELVLTKTIQNWILYAASLHECKTLCVKYYGFVISCYILLYSHHCLIGYFVNCTSLCLTKSIYHVTGTFWTYVTLSVTLCIQCISAIKPINSYRHPCAELYVRDKCYFIFVSVIIKYKKIALLLCLFICWFHSTMLCPLITCGWQS